MKDLKDYLINEANMAQMLNLTPVMYSALPKDISDIYDVLESILSWNDDDANNILLSMDNTKSFLEAIEENKLWKNLCDCVNDEDEDIKMTESKLKSLIKKYDKELTEIFLNMFDESIKELKS